MADQELALAGVTGVAVRCESCDMFALLPQERQGYTCPQCKMVTLLEEEVRCLRAERALQAPREQPPSGQRIEGEAAGGAAAETWSLELGNRFSPLGEAGADEASGDQQDPQPGTSGGKEAAAGEARARAWVPTSTRKVRRRVMVVGDSLLRGTEAAVCCPNLETREVCCLLGARIRRVKDRVGHLVHSGGHQLLLVIHVGTNDMARQGVVGTTRDFEALGKKLRELRPKWPSHQSYLSGDLDQEGTGGPPR
ncbi:hypothetical protein EYD10_06106 [Varanus komodoensis]|nr:hypothetical protein EYD10_06106 [Varanus komodoensis]